MCMCMFVCVCMCACIYVRERVDTLCCLMIPLTLPDLRVVRQLC